jgi:hypothetical protein
MISNGEFEHLCSFPKIIAQREGVIHPVLIENTDQKGRKEQKRTWSQERHDEMIALFRRCGSGLVRKMQEQER